jgi:RNA polymerase sigma-32 factor
MTHAISLPLHGPVGSIDEYLSTVNRFPRLSAEQERELAERFREEGDLDAARQLVLANLRCVVFIARGYLGYGLPFADLVQEGTVGLMKAVKRYDPAMGVRVVSFAVHWIRAEIHEYIIQNWRIVKVATTKAQRKLFFNLRKLKSRFGWFSPDEAQAVAGELGVDIADVYEMENRLLNSDVAMDGAADDGESERDNASAPIHYLRQDNADPAEVLERSNWGEYEQRRLQAAIETLDARSRDIVASRWLTEEKLTLHDLAARYSVSAERIRQLENSAMTKLRNALSAER